MAIAPPQLLTYEQYMAEEEINRRYDIIDGVRIFMANPNRRHQRIQRKITLLMAPFEEESGSGQTIPAPCDVLIRRNPLRTRQPDLLFISNERNAQNPPDTDPAPMNPAPELVVEILSPSDTRSVLEGKLADYASVNVLERWVVSPGLQTVEVLRLVNGIWERAATYRQGEIVTSIVFPGLTVAVDAIFAE